jgi:hypothetical protein
MVQAGPYTHHTHPAVYSPAPIISTSTGLLLSTIFELLIYDNCLARFSLSALVLV